MEITVFTEFLSKILRLLMVKSLVNSSENNKITKTYVDYMKWL